MSGYDTGLLGERIAAEHLKSLGLVIVAMRWRGSRGEADIIARDGKCLCFIEVKHRPLGRLGSGLASITPDKLGRLKQTAHEYLQAHPAQWRVGCLEITRAGVLYYPDVLHETQRTEHRIR